MIEFVFGIFEGIWRRWFGGWLNNIIILKNRFIQHIVGFSACFCLFYFKENSLLKSVIIALILQALYWARSHGCCFDFGHDVFPDVKRYDQLWYWKYVRLIIPESEWYTFTGDYILMTVRYTIPSILLALATWSFPILFAGIVLSSIYALMWKFYDWNYTDIPTEYAEFMGGFTTGILLACCA